MPTEALDQRMSALERANEIRSARTNLKRRWKKIDPRTARRQLCEIVMDPAPEFSTWRVETALMALPWVGRVKVRRWLLESSIPLNKTIAGMTERQRESLVEKVLARPW